MRVICRSGDPMTPADLQLGSPHAARSIVLLAPDGSEEPDAAVVKTALALVGDRERTNRYHVVAELQDSSNLDVARLVGRDEVAWVSANELISRIAVQTSRQSGLSVVYAELLGFDGCEIYMVRVPQLAGRTFHEARMAFVDASVIGLVVDDSSVLNPPAHTRIGERDELIVVAEDESSVRAASVPAPDESAIAAPEEVPVAPEHTLILGYSAALPFMLGELDAYVAPGSSVLVVADVDPLELPAFANLEVRFHRGDPTSRRVLDAIDVASAQHTVVVAETRLPPQRADARTLITLLHLRDIAERAGLELNVVSEMLDDRNRELAEVTDADDFIVSDKLVALTLTQLSENRRLFEVLEELFTAAGNEIYLRPAARYVRAGVECDFSTVVEAAGRLGETAIGYRVGADRHRSAAAYGVVINPRKDGRRVFAPDDRIIVLSEG